MGCMHFKRIGIIGSDSVGSMMGLLFAESGLEVSIYDPSSRNLDKAASHAKTAGLDSKISPYSEYKPFCKSLGSDGPKLFLLSIPHSFVGDAILDSPDPYLVRGDIIVDTSNEWYANTQRSQGRMAVRGVHYIGTGVSGGYQSARAGSSISPSGDDVALEKFMPLLEKTAAKDSTQSNTSCVAMVGPGGSGHYVKMERHNIHNGIEQGMVSALCEVWTLIHHNLSMSYSDITSYWSQWNESSPLKNNFLISIGIDILNTTDPVVLPTTLDRIKDKVVQNVNESEDTGVWTCEEDASNDTVTCPLTEPTIAKEFKSHFPALENFVAEAVQGNAIIPSIAATLEYLKYSSVSVNDQAGGLLTEFMEGELDYFGAHDLELRGEGWFCSIRTFVEKNRSPWRRYQYPKTFYTCHV